ncbi:MAG: DUF2235 domain-containing protein [Paracoccus sp. (in: a-proteobacteria)]|uniref:T6SS phospholipase effector Tle1-like catalytic domain-containing protein n=1 Tax=Paracoccus sp. TaxID=267 RepID=UPI0039E6D973
MDGTFASLTEGRGTSIARIHAMLAQGPVRLHYAEGQQWAAWRTVPELISGAMLDRNIRLAYGWLARNWRPGIPLYFFGYSRGALGVCALAQMIAHIGLIRAEHATDQNILCAWNMFRYCQNHRPDPAICHDHVPIRMLGLLDTVLSLGLRLPFLNPLSEPDFCYARGVLAPNVEHGAHALALDETRCAFAPILWQSPERDPRIEQCWFRGSHADIGGQLAGHETARPLANLPLVWLMSRAESLGLPLPAGWRDDHPCDAAAPPVGCWHSWGKLFLTRAARLAGADPSQALHPSVSVPYAGPARLIGHLTPAAQPRRPRLRLPGGDGMDSSATA